MSKEHFPKVCWISKSLVVNPTAIFRQEKTMEIIQTNIFFSKYFYRILKTKKIQIKYNMLCKLSFLPAVLKHKKIFYNQNLTNLLKLIMILFR